MRATTSTMCLIENNTRRGRDKSPRVRGRRRFGDAFLHLLVSGKVTVQILRGFYVAGREPQAKTKHRRLFAARLGTKASLLVHADPPVADAAALNLELLVSSQDGLLQVHGRTVASQAE